MKMPGFSAEASLCKSSNIYRLADFPDEPVGSRGVLTQLAPDNYTTRAVCEACGCKATDVACDCGMPPSRRKLDCINNGGPSRALPILSAVGIGGGVFRAS